MSRPLAALTAIAVVVTLSGCTLLGTFLPEPEPLSAELGSCLDGMNGADSDRTSVVDCSEPHLFEVTDIAEWPGMADKIAAADGDLGAVWDDLHLVNGTADNAAYGMWASRACNEAAQLTVGINYVTVGGHSAGDLWLRVGRPTASTSPSPRARDSSMGTTSPRTARWPGTTATPRCCWRLRHSNA